MKHLVLLVGLSYVIMHSSPPEIVHKCVFLFSMGYLVFIHWYRWYILKIVSVDITGPMMASFRFSFFSTYLFRLCNYLSQPPITILVQKVTVLAFSLHDGKVKKSDELNEIQKREALKSVPDILSFLSYMFHFQAVLTGPACFYTDYMAWIDGIAAVGKDGKIEKPWRAVLTKLLQATVFMLLYVFFGDCFTPDIIIDKYMNVNWVHWLFVLYVVMAFQRVPYYVAWTLG
ncbi:unnamed protein product [Acanthocheilonema viteae]|uniref:Uncharacterized protein n=1 Tax=Acanthocheilonema viteae TaxID=6277 RepID=A0A498ST11_ACAVI|nr:unnamed protein product [Acanthocheilonema viteae]